MKNYSIINILALISMFIFNVIILQSMSNLDMFDFFNVVYKIANLGQLFMLAALIISVIHQYVILYKYKIDSENNREKLNINIEKLVTLVKDLDLLVKNEVINKKTLTGKLSNVLKSLNYDSDFKSNAIFNSVVDILIEKIASNYTKFKEKKISLDYFTIEDIAKEMKNIISANQHFKVNTTYIIELTKTLLNDFARKKSANTSLDSKTLILDYFKILCENLYKSFQENKYIPTAEIEEEYQKMNMSEINGSENVSMQDAKAENINISINKI